MNILDKIFEPKKKPATTDGEKRENYMLSRFQLTKDPDKPFTYWLPSGKHYIEFNPDDVDSVMSAESELLTYYKAPKIREATKEEIMLKQGSTKKGKTSKPGDWQNELKPVGDIARNTQEMSTDPMGFGQYSPGPSKPRQGGHLPDLGNNPLGVGQPPTTDDVMHHLVGGGDGAGGDDTTDYLLGGVNTRPGKKPARKQTVKK